MSIGTSLLERQGRVFEFAGLRPQGELAHMGNIEQSRRRAGVEMLPQHAGGVLHWHVIAGEGHHLAATGDVEGVQRRLFQS
jgi:hypothetical protein